MSTVYGTSGPDWLSGTAGSDTIYGAAGSDYIFADLGADVVHAGRGDDTIQGSGGIDTMYGNRGNDYYYVDNHFDKVVEYANEGVDMVESQDSMTLPSNVEHLRLDDALSEKDNNLFGGGNNLGNLMIGNTGDNVLRGYSGNDTLDGAAGDDWLFGGTGDDRLLSGMTGGDWDEFTGGSGKDTFALYGDGYRNNTPDVSTVFIKDFQNDEKLEMIGFSYTFGMTRNGVREMTATDGEDTFKIFVAGTITDNHIVTVGSQF